MVCVRQAMTSVATEVCTAFSSQTDERGGHRRLVQLFDLRIAAHKVLCATSRIIGEKGCSLREVLLVTFCCLPLRCCFRVMSMLFRASTVGYENCIT